ncbi:MAG: TatD family hydrolase [Oscillospiraceae bacterium]|nr:TatD family hydrolase [Oscillospiraceae bacterium]MDY4192061.1 TatD family hydrolase [Oscillospiraceae bacterium]
MYRHIFDSHAHYNGRDFEDRDELIPHLFANGVCGVMDVASSMRSTRRTVELTARYDGMYSAIGVHPCEVGEMSEADYELLRELSHLPKVKAIGEIGLDYHWDDVAPEVQKLHFERQLQLAKELDLPVIIHSREAAQDTFDLLKKYRPRGVVHCYSGSAAMAEELLRLGLYIGFTGVITFKNARRAVESAQVVPLDRLLIETDCPYMAPEPHRGKRCDSSMLEFTGTRLAQIKEISPQELFDRTAENARALFEIDG